MKKKTRLIAVLLAALLLCAMLPTFASATMPDLPTHGNGSNVYIPDIPSGMGGMDGMGGIPGIFIDRSDETENNGPTFPIDRVSGVTLDLGDGDIVLYPDGYRQPADSDSLTPYSGTYIITGSRESDTPLRIVNRSGESASFELYFNSAGIRAADWCAAASIDCNADTVINIVNVGESIVQGYNHPAFVGGAENGARITVNILNTHYSSLTLNHLYLFIRTVAYAGSVNGEFLHNEAIEMFVNGGTPRNNKRMVLTDGVDVPEPETVSEPESEPVSEPETGSGTGPETGTKPETSSEPTGADGKSDPCGWCGGTHGGPFAKLIGLFHAIAAFFAGLIG